MKDWDEAVAAFRDRMQGVQPGDMLGPLNGHVPPDFRLVILDALPDGSLVFSIPFGKTPRIVPDPRGPFRWSDDADTFIDQGGDPHMIIDLDTLVTKAAFPTLPALYQKMRAFMAEYHVVGMTETNALIEADDELIIELDYLITVPGPRALEDDFVRCCQRILGGKWETSLTDRDQAFLITVMHRILVRCLGNTCVLRVEQLVPGSAPSSDPANLQH